MKLSKKAKILSMLCFLPLVSAGSCEPQVIPLNVKAEHPQRFVCERVDPESDRPALPPAHTIDWSSVLTVDQARGEHEAYKASILNRNGIVTGYITRLEGVNFVCWNNMEWQRQYYDGLPKD